MLKRFLTAPLVYVACVALLGGGLLIWFAVDTPGGDERSDRVIVDAGRTESLARQFERTRMRPPTRRELRDLVDAYVKEEILYREALALGLDRNDPVVRRRMRQKMEARAADRADRQQPTDADLEAFMNAHPEMFRSAGRVSFRQVFLDPGNSAGSIDARAERLRGRLNGDPEAVDMADAQGDPTLLPGQLNSATETAAARIFGEAFAGALADAPIGRWIGPIPSGSGVHLVRVSAREPGRLPALDAVRAAVEREWSAEQRAEADGRFYDALRARYTVEIEMPPETPAGTPAP